MASLLKSPLTGMLHTAAIQTIISGVLSLGILVGVILGKLPYEALFVFIRFLGLDQWHLKTKPKKNNIPERR